ncbi:multiple antibiotic resistance protein [Spirosomataceae bacterium TFI 002]|nr:multiple antibiotic resistance protein [Spirosomataceae bacterium TFI 002]
MNFNFKEIFSVSLIMFSIIDILGSIPVILKIKKKIGYINAESVTITSLILMIVYLFVGAEILNLFGVDIKSFAVAGGIILLLMGFEMILGHEIFKANPDPNAKPSAIVPLVFPVIAGSGSMTTILSLKAAYNVENIIIGIVINMIFVYIVLKSIKWIDRKMSPGTIEVLQKVFGLILIAIAIKLIKSNLGFDI